jgi:hypothetical protein
VFNANLDRKMTLVSSSVTDPSDTEIVNDGRPTETHELGQGSVAINVTPEADCLSQEGHDTHAAP